MGENVDSATVRLRLHSGEYILRPKEGARNSALWNSYKNVCVQKTQEYLGYVQCIKCESVFRFKKGFGTSNLSRHLDNCAVQRVNSSNTSIRGAGSSSGLEPETSDGSRRYGNTGRPGLMHDITESVPSPLLLQGSGCSQSSNTDTSPVDSPSPRAHSSQSSSEVETVPPPLAPPPRKRRNTTGEPRAKHPIEVPDHVKNALAVSCVKMCAVDLRPANMINGPGFQNVAQDLIQVGAKYGNVDAASVLPHSSTVSRKTSMVAEKVRGKFMPEVLTALKEKCCAFDADMWTDKYSKTAYLTTTAQYVTPDFELKSLVLFTTAFPADEAKTGSNIRKFATAALEKLGITVEDMKVTPHITDEGSNMIVAYADVNRLSCTAHNLATVLRHLLDEKFLRNNAPLVLSSLDVGRNVVTYLKRSGLSRLLPHSVKTLLETRWDSVVDMLMSVLDAFPHIVTILTKKQEQHRLDGWDGELMSTVVDFLIEFKNVTKELQAKKVPTIHNVLVRYHDLLKHCQPTEEDDEVCTGMRQSFGYGPKLKQITTYFLFYLLGNRYFEKKSCRTSARKAHYSR